MARPHHRIIYGTALAQQPRGMGEIIVGNPPSLHRLAPELLFCIAAARMGKDNWQGNLAIAEIIANALAHCRCIRGVVDGVINQLERDAKIAAITVKRVFNALIAFGDNSRNAAGGGKQRGRFCTDDREIFIFAGVDLALRSQLIDLTFGNHRARVAEDFEDLEAAVLYHQFERPAEQKITDQNARGIAPDEVSGTLAAPHVRSIDNIIMKQCRGMNEFDSGGELVMARTGIIKQLGAGERQHRAHPFAATGDQMARQLGNQGDFRLHPVQNDAVDLIHVGGNQRHNRIK